MTCPYCRTPTVDTEYRDEIHHQCWCGWFTLTRRKPCETPTSGDGDGSPPTGR